MTRKGSWKDTIDFLQYVKKGADCKDCRRIIDGMMKRIKRQHENITLSACVRELEGDGVPATDDLFYYRQALRKSGKNR